MFVLKLIWPHEWNMLDIIVFRWCDGLWGAHRHTILSMMTSIKKNAARKDRAEWHNLWERWEVERFIRPLSGSSRWRADGAGLAGLLTSWCAAVGMLRSPSAGPLILSYHFQSQAVTPSSHAGPTVSGSWQHGNSSQRQHSCVAVAKEEGEGKWLKVCERRLAEGWCFSLTWDWRQWDVGWH